MGNQIKREKKGRAGGAVLCSLLIGLFAAPAAPAEAASKAPLPPAAVISAAEAAQDSAAAPLAARISGKDADTAAAESRKTPPPEPAAPEPPQDIPAEAVEDSYFDDTVFLGDSRTQGFQLYSGLKTGQYLCSVGATVSSVFTKATEETSAGKVPILDALDELEFSKVYVMLGLNELGWPDTEQFHDQFAKLVDRIREGHPDAAVVLQSLLPVSARQDAKGSYVNNSRIQEYNAVIAQVAEEKDCTYLDVGAGLAGEDGCLPSGDNFDGVHLNVSGCKKWLEFLKEHPL